MKKLVSLLLCVLLVATFMSGCTKPETPDTPTNTAGGNTDPQQKDVTLTLWSIATESDAFNHAYTQAIADFESANPGVKIKHETFENESYKTKIKTAVSGNTLPDLFYSWGGGFSQPFVESGKVLELDSYYGAYKSELSEAALTYTTYDGKIYGSTYTTPVSALFYNKKIFDDNGVKAPTTFDELVQVCQTLKSKGITPIGISAKDTWVLAMTHDAMTLKSAGAEKVKATLTKQAGSNYDDADFLASAKAFMKLKEIGAFYEGAAAVSNDEASAMFYAGQVAMYTTGSWMAGSIQTDPENPEDFDVVPFPTLSDKAKLTDFMGGAVDTIMVSKSTSDADLAAKAAFELTKSISKYSYLDGAGLAVWKKDYDDSKVNTMTKKLADFASNATSFTLWFDTTMIAEDAGEYLKLLQEMYMGNKTPEDFVKGMDKNLKE